MTLQDVEARARQLLAPFADDSRAAERAAVIAGLVPRRSDYPQIFSAALAPRIAEHFEALWSTEPSIKRKPAQTALSVIARWSQDIAGNPDVAGGYARIAGELLPDVAWVWFRFTEPGKKRGMSYDGLIHRGDRFVWLPKPWRAVTGDHPLGHWAD